MGNDKAEYLKGREEFERKRPTVDVRVPSGKVFKLIRLEGLELMEVWRAIGYDGSQLSKEDAQAIGVKMYDTAQRVLDEFVSRFVVKPKLLPSTAPAEERERFLVTTDLAAADKMALINGLLTSSSGAEGKALADRFPDQAGGPGGRVPGQALP